MPPEPSLISEERLKEPPWHDGDWDRPAWFLSKDATILDAAGFPLDLRQRAAISLRWLYPPSVVREMFLANSVGPIVELFMQVGWKVAPLLELGLDIETVGLFDDPKLLGALRSRAGFAAAAFELSVWANLKRANLVVERVPTADAKTPDFRVLYEGQVHNIEVKALSVSDYEDERFLLSMELSSQLLALSPVPRHQITLNAQDALKTALDRTDAEVLRGLAPMLRSEARSLVELAKESPTALRHIGARLLELELSPAPDLESGGYGEAALPPDRDGRVEERALRLITRAAQQVESGNGVIVIDLVSQGVRPEQLRDAVRAKHATRPVAFAGTDVVVVRGSGIDRDGVPVRCAYVFSVTGAQLSPLHHQIAKFLPFRRFRNPTMVRPRPEGVRGTP